VPVNRWLEIAQVFERPERLENPAASHGMAKQKFRPARLGFFRGEGIHIV